MFHVKDIVITRTDIQPEIYSIVMTVKTQKAKRRKVRGGESRPAAGIGGGRPVVAGGCGRERGGALEPSVQTQGFVARGYRWVGLVQVRRSGLLDTDQPNLEKSGDGGQEADGKEIA